MDKPDYNNVDYDYVKYWDGRDYENNSEIAALRTLLPAKGEHVLDAGGGFGRLIPLYKNRFDQITIFDMSSKLLSYANQYAATLKTIVKTQEGDVYRLSQYQMPMFDCVVMIRVAHHLEELEQAIAQINNVLIPKGVLILEFANKMHVKSVIKNIFTLNLAYFNQDPVSRASRGVTFLNFHPTYVEKILKKQGFRIEKKLSVSNFRLGLLKRVIPLCVLNAAERLLQIPFSHINFGPSIFLKCVKI